MINTPQDYPFGLSGSRWCVFVKIRKSHRRAWRGGGLGASGLAGRRSPRGLTPTLCWWGEQFWTWNERLFLKYTEEAITHDMSFCCSNIHVLTFHLKQLPEKLKAVSVHSGRMKSSAGKSDQNLIAAGDQWSPQDLLRRQRASRAKCPLSSAPSLGGRLCAWICKRWVPQACCSVRWRLASHHVWCVWNIQLGCSEDEDVI